MFLSTIATAVAEDVEHVHDVLRFNAVSVSSWGSMLSALDAGMEQATLFLLRMLHIAVQASRVTQSCLCSAL